MTLFHLSPERCVTIAMQLLLVASFVASPALMGDPRLVALAAVFALAAFVSLKLYDRIAARDAEAVAA